MIEYLFNSVLHLSVDIPRPKTSVHHLKSDLQFRQKFFAFGRQNFLWEYIFRGGNTNMLSTIRRLRLGV